MKILKETLDKSVLDRLKQLQDAGNIELTSHKQIQIIDGKRIKAAPPILERMETDLDFDYNITPLDKEILVKHYDKISSVNIYINAYLQASIKDIKLKYTSRDFVKDVMKKHGKESVKKRLIRNEKYPLDFNLLDSNNIEHNVDILNQLQEIREMYDETDGIILSSSHFILLFDNVPTNYVHVKSDTGYNLIVGIYKYPQEKTIYEQLGVGQPFKEKVDKKYYDMVSTSINEYNFTPRGINNLYKLIEKKLKRLNTRSTTNKDRPDENLIIGGDKIPINTSTRTNYNSLIVNIVEDLMDDVLPSSGFLQSRFVYVMNNYKNTMEPFPLEREEKAIINRFINMAIQREVRVEGSFYDAKQNKVRGNYFEKLLKASPLPEIPTRYSDIDDALQFWAEGKEFTETDKLQKFIWDLLDDMPIQMLKDSVQLSYNNRQDKITINISYEVYIGGGKRNLGYMIELTRENNQITINGRMTTTAFQQFVPEVEKVIQDGRPLSMIALIVKSIFGKKSPALAIPIAGESTIRSAESKSIGLFKDILEGLNNPQAVGKLVDYNPIKYNPLTGTIKGGALIALDRKGLVYFPVDTNSLTFYGAITRGVCYFRINANVYTRDFEEKETEETELQVRYSVEMPSCIHIDNQAAPQWTGDVQGTGLLSVLTRTNPETSTEIQARLANQKVYLPSSDVEDVETFNAISKHPKFLYILAKVTNLTLNDMKNPGGTIRKITTIGEVLRAFEEYERGSLKDLYSNLPDKAYMGPFVTDYLASLTEIHSDISGDREYFEPNDGPWGFEDDERDWQQFEEFENREIDRDTRRRNIDE